MWDIESIRKTRSIGTAVEEASLFDILTLMIEGQFNGVNVGGQPTLGTCVSGKIINGGYLPVKARIEIALPP